ncbi:MAG: hypothetical protein JHD02_00230 [Thermoleophilaceae bacterium]|nr:hypothetical protein [Thermoleophilaceae bacterium]
MSIRANIAFRTPGPIEEKHLDTMSRVLSRQFGRESFHSSDEYIQLLTPIRNPTVIGPMERDLAIEFANSDFLYDVYTTRCFWDFDYLRGDFGAQLDWMKALKIAFPTIQVFYYGGDAQSTPWKPILPSEITDLRESYLHQAISDGIGYDANLRAGR